MALHSRSVPETQASITQPSMAWACPWRDAVRDWQHPTSAQISGVTTYLRQA
jgi:hypothetical protein